MREICCERGVCFKLLIFLRKSHPWYEMIRTRLSVRVTLNRICFVKQRRRWSPESFRVVHLWAVQDTDVPTSILVHGEAVILTQHCVPAITNIQKLTHLYRSQKFTHLSRSKSVGGILSSDCIQDSLLCSHTEFISQEKCAQENTHTHTHTHTHTLAIRFGQRQAD